MNAIKPMRPLAPLYRPDERFEVSKAGLGAWLSSEAFRRVQSFYYHYPPQSLQSDEARALLHHLIVMRRPERVLEIGTWHARTTEGMARALWEAGRGQIDTIDPFGGERCPPIIATFPPELQALITFRAENSAAYFDRAMSSNVYYDLVLVDGNHEFEYALFDLLCAARLMRPGGLIVMDNIEQVGPRLATKSFLERNPDWRDVADVVRHIDIAAPLAVPPPAFPDTKFYVLEAPPYYVVREQPHIFGPADVDRAEVEGIELELAAPAQGNLHVLVYARTFGLPEPEELRCEQSLVLDLAQLPADGCMRIPLNQPLRTAFPQSGLPRRVEISLAFTGSSGLALRAAPQPYPAKYGNAIGL
jgi:predicted O-methyltransferase YrrM